KRKLARLILAPNQEDLGRTVNALFTVDDLTSGAIAKFVSSNPALLGQNVSRLRVAQVLCVGGNATATIRNGLEVERYQLSGSHDSREWSVRGADVTLVGFD